MSTLFIAGLAGEQKGTGRTQQTGIALTQTPHKLVASWCCMKVSNTDMAILSRCNRSSHISEKSNHKINSWFLLRQLATYFWNLEESKTKVTKFQEQFDCFDSSCATMFVLVKSALNSVRCCHLSIVGHLGI